MQGEFIPFLQKTRAVFFCPNQQPSNGGHCYGSDNHPPSFGIRTEYDPKAGRDVRAWALLCSSCGDVMEIKQE